MQDTGHSCGEECHCTSVVLQVRSVLGLGTVDEVPEAEVAGTAAGACLCAQVYAPEGATRHAGEAAGANGGGGEGPWRAALHVQARGRTAAPSPRPPPARQRASCLSWAARPLHAC